VEAVELRDELLAEARRRGFAAAGIAGARPFRQARARALRAIDDGRMSGMDWYTPARVEAAADLCARHPWGRSLLALAWPYHPAALGEAAAPASPTGRPRGRMAAYACLEESAGEGPRVGGRAGGPAVDYHDLLARACDSLVEWLRLRVPSVRAKRFIDHGWAMDRAVAERAGVGFAGKNSCLITPGAGSYVLLAEVLLDLELPPTPPSRRSCGSCSACMPACPTGAIVAPGVIDSRRCIAYLTIEHRGPIPVELRPLIGTWAFGCDLCQEVCPINLRLAPPPIPAGEAGIERGPVPWPDLVACLELDADGFAQRFKHTAISRAGRAGLARNAAIALGNSADPAALPALRRAAEADPDPVVREAARWSIQRLEGAPAATHAAGTQA
jgi:epoxyqueuosine reductase